MEGKTTEERGKDRCRQGRVMDKKEWKRRVGEDDRTAGRVEEGKEKAGKDNG